MVEVEAKAEASAAAVVDLAAEIEAAVEALAEIEAEADSEENAVLSRCMTLNAPSARKIVKFLSNQRKEDLCIAKIVTLNTRDNLK
jgi:transcriptional regulatory protein LevR